MVKIVIENLAQKELSDVDQSKSILKVVQSHFIDWMIVVEGIDQLSRLTSAELKYRNAGQLSENERLACQTRVLGVCRIRVPEESKMPHMDYTS
jgi:2Fe-2S ferredoxin